MIDNSPYYTYKHRELTVEGFSRAMVQSVWRVPELDIGFDVGALPWHFLSTPHWFISHTHLDHLAALPVLVSRRGIMDYPTPTTVYLPKEMVEPAWDMLQVWERLDRGPMNCTLKGLSPGDEVELSRDHVVSAHRMQHTVPALGYVVWERRHKLKPEYQGLPGPKIRDLKDAGTVVTDDVRQPLMAYTGDTNPVGLDENPIFYEVPLLIVEMSFVRVNHRRDNIHAFGHMHIDDFIERADRFKNEKLIVCHISSRYDVEETVEAVREHVPEPLASRIHVWGNED